MGRVRGSAWNVKLKLLTHLFVLPLNALLHYFSGSNVTRYDYDCHALACTDSQPCMGLYGQPMRPIKRNKLSEIRNLR